MRSLIALPLLGGATSTFASQLPWIRHNVRSIDVLKLTFTNSSSTISDTSVTSTGSEVNTSQANPTDNSATPFDPNCIGITSGITITTYSIVPNTTTVTLTVTPNVTQAFSTPDEFTPPVYCPLLSPSTASQPPSAELLSTTTAIITAKVAPTVYTTASPVHFPGAGGNKEKPKAGPTRKVEPTPEPQSTDSGDPSPDTGRGTPKIPSGSSGAGRNVQATPISTTAAGMPLTVGPSNAVISGSTYGIGNGATASKIDVDGKTISLGPDGVGIAGTIVPPVSLPTNFLVLGAQPISAIDNSIAVVGDKTFTYGSGILETKDVFNGATITIGPSGIELPETRLGGTGNSGLSLALVGGVSVTEIGGSLAIVSGTTFTIGPDAKPTSAVVHGESILAGASGLSVAGITLSYPFNAITQTVTVGDITFQQIGSSLAVIDGETFTYGPGATPTSEVVDGQTVSIGPGGIGFSTTTVGATSSAEATISSKKSNAHVVGAVSLLRIIMSIGTALLM